MNTLHTLSSWKQRSSLTRLCLSRLSSGEPTGAIRFLLCVFLLTLVALSPARAQNFGRVEAMNSNVPSYFYHVQPGDATLQVEVMGPVRSPGLYIVSAGTTLNELLALSGGPALAARAQATSRTVIVRLRRLGSGGSAPIYEAEIDDAAIVLEGAPSLADGDVLGIEIVERRRFAWRDIFTVVNTAALIALAIERFSNLGD